MAKMYEGEDRTKGTITRLCGVNQEIFQKSEDEEQKAKKIRREEKETQTA